MIKKISVILLTLFSFQVFGWGLTGHRTVGEIAQRHLSRKASKKIEQILKCKSIAVASNWMDDVKSDSVYDHTHSWHWVTIPDGQTYEESEKNPDGDLIQTIEALITKLKAGNLSAQDEAESLSMLIHLIGDIHQPLHVGNGQDLGGNKLKVEWFWEKSNLHRVWDSDMIDSQKFSYTEMATNLDKVSKDKIKEWQASTVRDWARESMALRDQVYDLPHDNKINYEYRYKNWETLELRLTQAGIRLAGVLNDIYE